jgi:deoxyribonuclease-4
MRSALRIGFHVSAAGGFKEVIPRALGRQCTTMQIFSRNPRQWDFKQLDPADVATFKKMRKDANIYPVFVHMPYIVNLASPDRDLHERSIDSLTIELQRTAQLGAQYVVVHAGSSEDTDKGIKRMIHAIDRALNSAKNRVVLLIENTSGSGKELGDKFAHIGTIIDGSNCEDRLGMVLDTAHAFAAGYDLHSKSGINAMLEEIDDVVGIVHLHLVHLNDSKSECGSHYDRHEHVGKGKIGKGLKYILNHPLLASKPFIMETPRMNVEDDLRNLRTVRKYLKSES